MGDCGKIKLKEGHYNKIRAGLVKFSMIRESLGQYFMKKDFILHSLTFAFTDSGQTTSTM